MTYTDDFNQKRDAILAIAMDAIKTPAMPLEAFHKGAEYLDMWCQNDKSKLEAAGLAWALVLDLPYRIGASRYAQANWDAKRFGRKEAQARWVSESPEMYDTRNSVIHAMLYAYRKDEELLNRVRRVAEGDGDADMLEDINVLDAIARENRAPLEAIGFDMGVIDKLGENGKAWAKLRAQSSVDNDALKEDKLIRDKAYTHLKEAVDEIRACGQYVFWRDANRRQGYVSQYHKKRSAKKATAQTSNTEG